MAEQGGQTTPPASKTEATAFTFESSLQSENEAVAPSTETEIEAVNPTTAGPSPTQLDQPAGRGWKFWMIFIPLCVGTLLAALESTVTSTALPSIVQDLQSGDVYVWFLNGYLLTSTALMPLYGQFAAILGRRWPAMFAVAVFTLGSGISGGATTTLMLIAGRVIQGIGGGGISIMTQLIVSDLVSLRERGQYMGIVFGVFGLGATLGPVIGGVITSHASWRWIFWLNLPIGGVTLILQFFFLQVHYTKRSTFEEKMKKIDWIGNFILITSVVSVLIALSWSDTRYPWSDWHIIVPLVLGFAGTALFHVYEATDFCEQPTIPPRAFGNRTSTAALVLNFVQSMLTFWQIYFLPVYFQAVRLNSPQLSGIMLLPSIATGIPVTIVAGLILTKTGRYKPLHLFGFVVMTLALGLFILFDANSSLAEVIIFQIIAGLGTGCVLTTLLPAVQAGLPQEDVAIATSTWGFLRSYGSIWGVAVPAAIFNNAFANSLDTITDPVTKALLSGGSGYSHVSSTFVNSLPDVTRQQVIQVYSDSLKLIWQVALALSGPCILLVFLEKEIKLRTTVQSDYGIKQEQKKIDEEKGKDTGTPEEKTAPIDVEEKQASV